VLAGCRPWHPRIAVRGGKPVKQWTDKDDACFDVEEGLRETIAEVLRADDNRQPARR
jgi:hypothetical protein